MAMTATTRIVNQTQRLPLKNDPRLSIAACLTAKPARAARWQRQAPP
jgi:hypothetical protein